MNPNFEIFNATFGAPPDEPLRLVSPKSVVFTDQQREEGAMWIGFHSKQNGTYEEFRIIGHDTGMLTLAYSPLFAPQASSWLNLAETLGAFGPTDYGMELVALFRQVGQDTKFRNYFVLQLNS